MSFSFENLFKHFIFCQQLIGNRQGLILNYVTCSCTASHSHYFFFREEKNLRIHINKLEILLIFILTIGLHIYSLAHMRKKTGERQRCSSTLYDKVGWKVAKVVRGEGLWLIIPPPCSPAPLKLAKYRLRFIWQFTRHRK